MSEDLDRFLGDCLRSYLASQGAPAFPASLSREPALVCDRISFHGLALLLVQLDPKMETWPDALRKQVREQARLQTFWEATHRKALEELFGMLEQQAIHPVVFKGTALAYSVYPDPALRRRGDTDFLIRREDRAAVRKALSQMGFARDNDTVALQETWTRDTTFGFGHSIDVHWRWKSSAAISEQLEHALPDASIRQAKMGSSTIRTPDTIGTIILLSVNRCSHESYGYRAGEAKLSGSDRLIWAADFDLLSRLMTPKEWDELPVRAASASCAKLVCDALQFARATVGTDIPAHIIDALGEDEGPVTRYLFGSTSFEKLKQDFAASSDLTDRIELVKYRLFPSERVLAERFPNAAGWPLPALQARRLASSLGRAIAGKA